MAHQPDCQFGDAQDDFDDLKEGCCESPASFGRYTKRHCNFVSLIIVGLVGLALLSVNYYRTNDVYNRLHDMEESQMEFQANTTASLAEIIALVTVPLPARDEHGIGIGPAFGNYQQQIYNELALEECADTNSLTLGCVAHYLWEQEFGARRRETTLELPAVA